MSKRLYTPIFRTPTAKGIKASEAFLPYNEAMHETKTGAKIWARENGQSIFGTTLLSFTGRVLSLDAEGNSHKYPSVELPVFEAKPTDNPDSFQMALISGPMHDEAVKSIKRKQEAGEDVWEENKLLKVDLGGEE